MSGQSALELLSLALYNQRGKTEKVAIGKLTVDDLKGTHQDAYFYVF